MPETPLPQGGNRNVDDVMVKARSGHVGHLTVPILLTTNKPFSEWGDVFSSAACVVTLVDRLIHRSEIVQLDGESYRLREAKEQAAKRSKARSRRTAKSRAS